MDSFNQWLIFQQFGKIAGIQIQIKTQPTSMTNTEFNLQSQYQECLEYFWSSYCQMWPWSTKAVISNTGIFVAIANCMGQMIDFSVMPKIIRILRSCSMKIFCKFPTVNISKLNFWLVICIAKKFIWTTLKVIFSIFKFFCTLRFQIYK